MYFIGTLNKDVADMNLKCADEKGALTMGEQEAGEHLADLAKAGRRCYGGNRTPTVLGKCMDAGWEERLRLVAGDAERAIIHERI